MQSLFSKTYHIPYTGMKKIISCLTLFLLLLGCGRQPSMRLKVVLLQSAENSMKNISEQKVARQAVKKFNAETNINGLPLELEIVDFEDIHSSAALQNYLLQKYDSQGRQKKSVIAGFIIGSGLASEEVAKLLTGKSYVVIGGIGGGLDDRYGNPDSRPSRNAGPKLLTIAEPVFQANKYLLEYLRQERGLESLYVVYDQENRGLARNFILRSGARGLEYVQAQADYKQGRIQSLAGLFRSERLTLQNRKKRHGIVMFLSPEYSNKEHRYLATSPYRYFFGNLDFLLYTRNRQWTDLRDPDIAEYFLFSRQRDYNLSSENYGLFVQEYQKNFHLQASEGLAQLFDAVTLLARGAKQILENSEEVSDLGSVLFQYLLRMEYRGVTGPVFFNPQGQRLVDYTVLQFRNGKVQVEAEYSGYKQEG